MNLFIFSLIFVTILIGYGCLQGAQSTIDEKLFNPAMRTQRLTKVILMGILLLLISASMILWQLKEVLERLPVPVNS